MKTEKKKRENTKKSILRTRIPLFVENVNTWNETTNQAIKILTLIWKHLLNVDPQNTTIEYWNTGNSPKFKPLRISSIFPTSKGKIHQRLVEDLKINWATSNNPTDLRFILGHKKNIRIYMENKELARKMEDLNIEIFVDRIQGEVRAVAGYLAGPIIRERSAELIADILQSSPVFKANKISQLEIYEDVITIRQGSNKRQIKRTRAMHVRVRDEEKAVARTCLASSFPSKARGDYPMGIQFRFVPNTADPDFAVPPSARSIAMRLKAKQASFLERSITRQNKHFKDIFSLHEFDHNISLLKVLMSLKSKRFPERQLFTCIEQDVEDGEVYIQYTEELEDEADGIIPVLPLYLEGQFGSGIKRWLKPSAAIGTQGYEYLRHSNKVIPNGNNPLQQVNRDWEQRVDNTEGLSISDIDSDEELEGFAIEFGDMDLNNETRKSNLGEDSASLGTLGLAKPADFIVPSDSSDSSEASTSSTESPHKQLKDNISLEPKREDSSAGYITNPPPNKTNSVSSKQDGDGIVT